MPYYPEGKELEDSCKKLRLYSVCAICKGKLVLKYDFDNHREVILCSEDESHEELRKTRPENLKQKRREISMDSKELMTLDTPGMMQRIDMARFPQELKPAEKALIATVAMSYGLDPIMNELTIYQGRPYPTVNAWYRKSQETGKFDGMDSRPATKEEREERNAGEGDILYRCEVWRKGASNPFVGWGKVRAKETKPGSTKDGDTTSTFKPIQNDPDRMAEKRAEMMAMRKAFSIPMPAMSFEEIIETESGRVSTVTGEIKEEPLVIEGKARVIEGDDLSLQPHPVTEGEPDLRQVDDTDITPLVAKLKEKGKSKEELGTFANDKQGWGISSMSELLKWHLPIIDKWLEGGEKGA